MHDPSTVAFDIHYPWYHYRPWPKVFKVGEWDKLSHRQKKGRSRNWREGWRETFITIGHEDPCSDGSDDSCGFSSPKLTKEEREQSLQIGESEYKDLFTHCGDDLTTVKAKTSAVQGIFCIYQMVAWRIWRKDIKGSHMPSIMSLSSSPWDSFTEPFSGKQIPKGRAVELDPESRGRMGAQGASDGGRGRHDPHRAGTPALR